MTLDQINKAEEHAVREEFLRCCGSKNWAKQMAKCRPFHDAKELLRTAEIIWKELSKEDWLEAFTCHPKIGDLESLHATFSHTQAWAEAEQAGVTKASDESLKKLAERNKLYEETYGYIFIVCATGKSAEDMLAMLEQRLGNDARTEIGIAAGEQSKITAIRLEKLLQR